MTGPLPGLAWVRHGDSQRLSSESEARERLGSLTIVGTGLSLASHITSEALHYLQGADKVFYLLTTKTEEEWISTLNPTAASLADCYVEGRSRAIAYRLMTDRIMSAVRERMAVCVAFYGHPGVFARSTHDAVRQARHEGYTARMLPGISAEDCLFADLGIDPGDYGCQSFEASDFLIYRRRFDPTSALILWQVGLLGESSVTVTPAEQKGRLKVLAALLRKHYPAGHPVASYEAAHFPTGDPTILWLKLSELSDLVVPLEVTMYLPPRSQRRADPRIAMWFTELDKRMDLRKDNTAVED